MVKKNQTVNNILIITLSLIGIMLLSTFLVVGFNYLVGFSIDVDNDHVATAISAVAFVIAVVWKFIFDRTSNNSYI